MIDKEKFIKEIKKDLNIQTNKEKYENFNISEKFTKIEELEDLEDIFETFYNKQKAKNDKNNIYTTCKINEKEANYGCTKKIKIWTNTYCEKTGKIKKQKEEKEIKIPKGIKNGNQILLKGEGNNTKQDISRGDLYVTINIE